MEYWKMRTTKDDGSLFGATTVWYGLEPEEGSVIKDSEKYQKEYGVVYAIRKNTDTTPIGTLLTHLMEMNRDDLETILLNDEFLEKIFFCYLQNPMCSREFRGKLEKVRQEAGQAARAANEAADTAETAGLWSLLGALKG